MTKAALKKARKEALQSAIDAAGGQTVLADKIGTSQSQIHYWLEKAKKGVPAEFALKIEKVTGVERWKLCPNIFAPPAGAGTEPARACA